jgi:hypothetical protein
VRPDDNREFSVMVAIFSVSAGMVGVCLTGIGLVQVLTSLKKVSTLADEFLSVNASIFLCCCLLTFISFRLRHARAKEKLQRVADVLFFVGLLMMAVICVLISRAFV